MTPIASTKALNCTTMPGWVPEAAQQYLAHVAAGQSLRDIAKAAGQAPSTICRRVRQIEARRDDPLIDDALSYLAEITVSGSQMTKKRRCGV